jgi:hypothetical protein
MRGTRTTSTLGAAAVAGIAAWASWTHMVHVALSFGERAEVAYVLPLSVDGLLVVASAAMVGDKSAGRRPRTSAKVAFIAEVSASIAANITAAHPSIVARAVAAWPAIALLLVVELMTRKGRLEAASLDRTTAEAGDRTVESLTPFLASLETGPVMAEQVDLRGDAKVDGDNDLDATGDARVPAQRVPAKSLTNRARVEEAAAKMPAATVAQIAAKAGGSESTARRYLPRSDTKMASPSSGLAGKMGPEQPESQLVGVTACQL